jgi:hypothetical protein
MDLESQMRKVFYSGAVFASLFLAIQGCNDPSKIEVEPVVVDQNDDWHTVSRTIQPTTVDIPNCEKNESDLVISDEVKAAAIDVEATVKVKKTQLVDCGGKDAGAFDIPAEDIVSQIDYQADFARTGEVAFVEIENKRSCGVLTLNTDQPDSEVEPDATKLPISSFKSDGTLKLIVQKMPSFHLDLLGLGLDNRTQVYEGMNLIKVRFLGAFHQELEAKEFQLNFKIKNVVLVPIESKSICSTGKTN